MKLSEAIRLGSMMKPKGHLALLQDGKTCALGAALDAIGILKDVYRGEEGYQEATRLWPILAQIAHCPLLGKPVGLQSCYHNDERVRSLVWHINDYHGWTREQIADWVETIEAQHEAEAGIKEIPVAVA